MSWETNPTDDPVGTEYALVLTRGEGIERRICQLVESLGLGYYDMAVINRTFFDDIAHYGIHSETADVPE